MIQVNLEHGTIAVLFSFKHLICSPDVKKSNIFNEFAPRSPPLNPHQGSLVNQVQSLLHLKTPTWMWKSFRDRFSRNITFQNSTFFQKRTLVKLLEKAKLFAENFSENSYLDDSGISLPVFPSRTNLKLNNLSVTLDIVKKVITNLDLSKASGPDCIPVVVLKSCEPEFSFLLAELFNKCLKESSFPDYWKVWSVVPVFTNVWERSTAKNYRPVSLVSVVV